MSYSGGRRVSLHHGDCLDVLPSLEAESVDTCITDPPAGISFMNKEWDGDKGGRDAWIAWLTKVMKEVYRVMKPGGALVVWSIPRTSHWTGTAIEAAGFRIFDVITHLTGQGFPKSHNIGKATGVPEWDGWGTALKPAAEFWWLAYKPRDGTFAENALKHGVAGLWVDGGRIRTTRADVEARASRNGKTDRPAGWFDSGNLPDRTGIESGRWPANVTLQHHEDCVRVGTRQLKSRGGAEVGHSEDRSGYNGAWGDMDPKLYHRNPDGTESVEAWDCHEDCPARLLDEQSGERPQCTTDPSNRTPSNNGYGGGWGGNQIDKPREYETLSGASRFFYCAKSSRSERNEGLGGDTNGHPTVKPLDLLRYLCKLTKTPTGGVVLDPFAGSGSTGCAAVLEGRDFIGIELEAEYMEIAERRIEHHASKPRQLELL